MLQLKNIVKDYHTGDEVVQALKGVSVNFRRNEFVSILGQSGCGKTTTLRMIAGFAIPTKGQILLASRQRISSQETGIHIETIQSDLYSRATI